MLFPMLLSALLLFLFGSCTDEQINNPTPNGEEKQITLSLTTPKSFIAATYADPAAVDENEIQTIDVLVFDDDGNYFSGPHFGSLTSSGSTSDVKINIPNSVVAGYKLAIFANSRKAINAVASTFATTDNKETTLKKIVLDDKVTPSQWETSDSKNLIPMHAEVDFSAITSTVSLVRMVARIDVTVTSESLADFDLKTVHLYKHNTVGYVAPIAATGAPSIPEGTIKATSPLLYSTTSNEVKNQIYTFEAAAGDGTDFSENTCLVIGGRYNGDTADSYYRVDFYGKKQSETDNAYLALLRNHLYTVSVSKVYGPGYDDPDKAAASKPINVTYNIDAWDTSTIVDGGYNGQYMIGVSAAEFNFDAAARGTSTGDNILIIKTNHPDGWSWKASDGTSDLDPSTGWLKLTTMAGADITAPVKNSDGSPITSEVRLLLANNDPGSPRSGIIKLTAGNVVYDISVTQSNTLNDDNLFPSEAADYSLRPNGDRIFIPVSRANAGGTINLNNGDVFTVDYTTTPVEGSMPVIKAVKPVGTGASGQVYVETGTGSGTATVSLKSADGANIFCTWTITVREPESNCYIVAPGKKILIPVSRANAASADLGGEQLTETGGFAAELIWVEDASIVKTLGVCGTGSNGYIYVETGSMIDGNAVVGIRKQGAGENDGFLWSWHIWVTDYDPGSPASGYFMDRNLGALNNGFLNNQKGGTLSPDAKTAGLLYQWGRKDPFPGTNNYLSDPQSGGVEPTLHFGQGKYTRAGSGQTGQIKISECKDATNLANNSTYSPVSTAPTTNNLGYAVSNPHIFYFNDDSNDWYIPTSGGAYNDNLWGNNSASKTIYDPCPPGWRVPNNDIWDTALNGKASTIGNLQSYGGDIGVNWVAEGLIFASTGIWVAPQLSPTFFPASGRRSGTNGSMGYVGSNGYSWSASPVNTASIIGGGASLLFNSSILRSPGYANHSNRAAGNPVRCYKEL